MSFFHCASKLIPILRIPRDTDGQDGLSQQKKQLMLGTRDYRPAALESLDPNREEAAFKRLLAGTVEWQVRQPRVRGRVGEEELKTTVVNAWRELARKIKP